MTLTNNTTKQTEYVNSEINKLKEQINSVDQYVRTVDAKTSNLANADITINGRIDTNTNSIATVNNSVITNKQAFDSKEAHNDQIHKTYDNILGIDRDGTYTQITTNKFNTVNEVIDREDVGIIKFDEKHTEQSFYNSVTAQFNQIGTTRRSLIYSVINPDDDKAFDDNYDHSIIVELDNTEIERFEIEYAVGRTLNVLIPGYGTIHMNFTNNDGLYEYGIYADETINFGDSRLNVSCVYTTKTIFEGCEISYPTPSTSTYTLPECDYIYVDKLRLINAHNDFTCAKFTWNAATRNFTSINISSLPKCYVEREVLNPYTITDSGSREFEDDMGTNTYEIADYYVNPVFINYGTITVKFDGAQINRFNINEAISGKNVTLPNSYGVINIHNTNNANHYKLTVSADTYLSFSGHVLLIEYSYTTNTLFNQMYDTIPYYITSQSEITIPECDYIKLPGYLINAHVSKSNSCFTWNATTRTLKIEDDWYWRLPLSITLYKSHEYVAPISKSVTVPYEFIESAIVKYTINGAEYSNYIDIDELKQTGRVSVSAQTVSLTPPTTITVSKDGDNYTISLDRTNQSGDDYLGYKFDKLELEAKVVYYSGLNYLDKDGLTLSGDLIAEATDTYPTKYKMIDAQQRGVHCREATIDHLYNDTAITFEDDVSTSVRQIYDTLLNIQTGSGVLVGAELDEHITDFTNVGNGTDAPLLSISDASSGTTIKANFPKNSLLTAGTPTTLITTEEINHYYKDVDLDNLPLSKFSINVNGAAGTYKYAIGVKGETKALYVKYGSSYYTHIPVLEEGTSETVWYVIVPSQQATGIITLTSEISRVDPDGPLCCKLVVTKNFTDNLALDVYSLSNYDDYMVSEDFGITTRSNYIGDEIDSFTWNSNTDHYLSRNYSQLTEYGYVYVSINNELHKVYLTDEIPVLYWSTEGHDTDYFPDINVTGYGDAAGTTLNEIYFADSSTNGHAGLQVKVYAPGELLDESHPDVSERTSDCYYYKDGDKWITYSQFNNEVKLYVNGNNLNLYYPSTTKYLSDAACVAAKLDMSINETVKFNYVSNKDVIMEYDTPTYTMVTPSVRINDIPIILRRLDALEERVSKIEARLDRNLIY